jgi:hypothetical protein
MGFDRTPASQARGPNAPVRATSGVRTRTPLTGSTSPGGEVGRVGPTESKVRLRPEHPFTHRRCPPGQGCGPPLPATRNASTTHQAPSSLHEKMPLANLCSRLVVTSTRRNTPFPSFGLSPFRPTRPAARFRPDRCPGFDAPLSTATTDSRCRHLRPWVVTQLLLRLQLLSDPPPRRATRCPECSARATVLRTARAQ